MIIDQPRNTVLQGDCLDILPTLRAASVNFVLTDPPYITRYRSRDGRTIVNDDNDAWLKPSFSEVHRVLTRNSYCVSFYGWSRADRFLEAYRAADFRVVGHLVFTKRYASTVKHVRYQHECAYLLAKGYPREPREPIADVLRWSYTGNREHPTQKPLTVLSPLVTAFSMPGDTVLDPFAGSGSSLVAAQSHGRDYLGIEIDPVHHATAMRRLAKNESRSA